MSPLAGYFRLHLGLKWGDVDLEGGKLHVRRTLSFTKEGASFGTPKTKGSRRTVKLTSGAVDALRAHLGRQLEEMELAGDEYEPGGLVFATEAGAPIRWANAYRRFERLLREADLPHIRFHDLRHTCATLLLSRGHHPKLVQELLGHAKVSITLDTYSHILPSMGDQTAAAMEAALF